MLSGLRCHGDPQHIILAAFHHHRSAVILYTAILLGIETLASESLKMKQEQSIGTPDNR
jgi:hypothetical protein